MPFIEPLLKYINNVFLETGTFQGDTIYRVANNDICKPQKIISLELSDVFFNNCVKRFTDDSKIFLHHANSKYDLYDIIKNINSHITFWLDGHWSGTPNVGCDVETICPVLEELQQIKQHNLKTHTIIVNDIRLMNSSENKYEGFPVSTEQIIKIILEINPMYTIKYYDDVYGSKDILVAYIEDKVCIHKYLTKCMTNPQPPGFADFLRGSIALYNFSQKHGYKLLFDNEHPLYKYIKPNENIISTDTSYNLIEILPPLHYDTIYHKLNNMFADNKSFKVMTNAFYNLCNDGIVHNWGGISHECAAYFRKVFCPSVELDNKIEYVMNSVYGIKSGQPFKIIHLRFGDKFIHKNTYDDSLYNLYYNKISDIINNNKNIQYVLISDSSIIANKLKADIKELYYWDNKKIHIGDLINNAESALLDTLTDFFIMSKSNEIISSGSGFSQSVSIIYNLKYTLF